MLSVKVPLVRGVTERQPGLPPVPCAPPLDEPPAALPDEVPPVWFLAPPKLPVPSGVDDDEQPKNPQLRSPNTSSLADKIPEQLLRTLEPGHKIQKATNCQPAGSVQRGHRAAAFPPATAGFAQNDKCRMVDLTQQIC